MARSDLSHKIGEHMKTEASGVDSRFERYARGELEDGELAALEAEAAGDPALGEAIALHAPLSADLRAQLHAQALRTVRTSSRRRRLVAATAVVAGLAAAAALVLLFRTRPAPLPVFVAVIEVGDQEWRGQVQTNQQIVDLDTHVSILLRPAHAVAGEIEAVLWVRAGGGTFRSPVAAETSPDGTVRWTGTAGSLTDGRIGASTFIAVVGRAGALPGGEAAGTEPDGADSRSFSVTVDVHALRSPAGP